METRAAALGRAGTMIRRRAAALPTSQRCGVGSRSTGAMRQPGPAAV